jgi:hypothetical protein
MAVVAGWSAGRHSRCRQVWYPGEGVSAPSGARERPWARGRRAGAFCRKARIITPIIGTGCQGRSIATETRAATQYNNQYPDGGQPGSFWTACRERCQERADDNVTGAIIRPLLLGPHTLAHRAGTGRKSQHGYRGIMSVTCSPIWRSLVAVSSSITCPVCVCTFTRLVSVSTATTVARTVPRSWPAGPLVPGCAS